MWQNNNMMMLEDGVEKENLSNLGEGDLEFSLKKLVKSGRL